MISTYTSWYRKYRMELIRIFGSKCWSCGMGCSYSDANFAHIKPNGLNGKGRGSYNRMKDVMENPDSYALLHKLCHEWYDRGEISLKPELMVRFKGKITW